MANAAPCARCMRRSVRADPHCPFSTRGPFCLIAPNPRPISPRVKHRRRPRLAKGSSRSENPRRLRRLSPDGRAACSNGDSVLITDRRIPATGPNGHGTPYLRSGAARLTMGFIQAFPTKEGHGHPRAIPCTGRPASALCDLSCQAGRDFWPSSTTSRAIRAPLSPASTISPSRTTCSCRGQKNESLRLAERVWVRLRGGAVHDRDVNAALNIGARDLAVQDRQTADLCPWRPCTTTAKRGDNGR